MFTAKNISRWTFSLHLLHLRFECEDNFFTFMKTREMVDFHCRVIFACVRAWNLRKQIKEAKYKVSPIK